MNWSVRVTVKQGTQTDRQTKIETEIVRQREREDTSLVSERILIK